MRHIVWFLGLLVLFATPVVWAGTEGTGTGTAASSGDKTGNAAEKKKPDIAPEAAAPLGAMCDLLKSQQEFSFSAEVTEEQVYPNGQTISLTRIVEVAVKRPDKLYARIVGDGRDRVFVYDGKTVTVADLDRDVYATVETPPTIDATLDMLATKYGLAAPLSDLLHSDPCAVMLEDVRTGDFVGRHLAAGKVTDHLAFSQKEADWQIWVEDGPKPLPRKFVLNDKEVMGWPQFAATFTAWNLNPHLSAKLFVFTPEPDARRIDCPPQGCEPVEKK